MNIQETTIRAVIPADSEYIDVIRLILYGITKKLGFSYEEIEDIKVAVTEACNNAVLYAYIEEEYGEIEVEFDIFENKFRVKVMDHGKSFDVQNTTNKVMSLHDRQLKEVEIGGLGILLMQTLMDEVQINKKMGTEVIMTKWIRKHA